MHLSSESAVVVSRQQQLALTSRKKAKATEPAEAPADAPEGVPEDSDPEAAKKAAPKGKPKAKATGKASAKARGKPKKGPAAVEENDETPEEIGGSKRRKCKLAKKPSARLGLCKRVKAKKNQKAKEAEPDDATLYYEETGDQEQQEETAEEWDAWKGWEDPEKASRRVRGKSSKKEASEEDEGEEPDGGQDGEQEKEPDEEQDDAVPTFARRYCGTRPFFRAKFLAIRDAFIAGIKPFVKYPGKYEDPNQHV